MATNVYGVRVLDVAPDELRARFKVFVLEGGAANPPVPDDPTFFFYALWERGGLADLFDVKTVLDYAWVNANTRRFVARVERVASAKKPLREFDYDVWVTDVRWLEDLTVGDDWDTTFWPFHADVWTPDDAPHIPDLTEPVRRISPFAGKKGDFTYEHVQELAYSDDGKYLAASSWNGLVWVYDTADWSEVAHMNAGDWIVAMPMWVPGEHVLTLKSYGKLSDPDPQEQWAFDVRTGQEITAPYQFGHLRSHDGVHRVTPNGLDEGGYDLHETDALPQRTISHAGTWDPIQCKAFSADGTKLFLGAQQNLYVVDPVTARVTDKVMDATGRFFDLAASPDGSYLAAASFSRKLDYLGPFGEKRPHELCIWRTADRKIILGRQMETYIDALAWSPDGRRLVASLEPCDGNFARGQSELAVFAMGPRDEPLPGE